MAAAHCCWHGKAVRVLLSAYELQADIYQVGSGASPPPDGSVLLNAKDALVAGEYASLKLKQAPYAGFDICLIELYESTTVRRAPIGLPSLETSRGHNTYIRGARHKPLDVIKAAFFHIWHMLVLSESYGTSGMLTSSKHSKASIFDMSQHVWLALLPAHWTLRTFSC